MLDDVLQSDSSSLIRGAVTRKVLQIIDNRDYVTGYVVSIIYVQIRTPDPPFSHVRGGAGRETRTKLPPLASLGMRLDAYILYLEHTL